MKNLVARPLALLCSALFILLLLFPGIQISAASPLDSTTSVVLENAVGSP